jgi:oxysterol-binding protein-related protein 9/10/11
MAVELWNIGTEADGFVCSHHPPATAYSITNTKTGVHLEGYNAQKATFSKTINIKQIGHAVLTVPAPDKTKETYLITLPSLHIEGLIFGAPFIELDSTSYITSSTGFTARIDYSGRGWLSGKKNSVTATLYPTGLEKEVLYNANGVWTKSFDIFSGPAKTNSSSTLVESYDPTTLPTTKLIVAPLETQHPLESRKAWAKVAAAIAQGDLDAVSADKGKIEKAQREMRAREKSEGRSWERRYFSAVQGGDPVLEKLAKIVGLSEDGEAEKTGGLWRFDKKKAEEVKGKALTVEEAAKIEEELLGQ